jgi:hypothetical protein
MPRKTIGMQESQEARSQTIRARCNNYRHANDISEQRMDGNPAKSRFSSVTGTFSRPPAQ